MNRRDRRKLKKQGIQVPKDPSINIKLSDLGRDIMTPTMESAMMHEINQQCLEADKRFSLDLYPERYKLKEKGIDLEKWQEEVLNNDP